MMHDRQTLWPSTFGVVVHFYIFLCPQGKRTTCDGQIGEGDLYVQLYIGSVSIAHISVTFAQRSCDVQY